MLRECPGCKAVFPKGDGPTDRYGVMSPECFAAFNLILVSEGTNFGYPPAHRLLVDACALQHPPRAEHQTALDVEMRLRAASIQSIAIHLIALHLAFEQNMALLSIAGAMNRVLTNMNARNCTFAELIPPQDLGKIRVIDIERTVTKYVFPYEEYETIITAWAQSVWVAWAEHHNTIRSWYGLYK